MNWTALAIVGLSVTIIGTAVYIRSEIISAKRLAEAVLADAARKKAQGKEDLTRILDTFVEIVKNA